MSVKLKVLCLTMLVLATSSAALVRAEPPSTAAAMVAPSVESEAFTAMMSPGPDGHSMIYEVQSGDNLTKISKRFSVAVGALKRINGLQSDLIQVGMKLKIPTYKFSVVVDKSQNILILKGDETVLKTYTVSTGTDNSTPAGIFKVTDKLIDPTWYKEGAVVPPGSPENILGTRWIGIDKPSYGIHGTTEPEKLGQQSTAGCVRMKNEEVEELYDILVPGTEVTIVD